MCPTDSSGRGQRLEFTSSSYTICLDSAQWFTSYKWVTSFNPCPDSLAKSDLIEFFFGGGVVVLVLWRFRVAPRYSDPIIGLVLMGIPAESGN